MKIKIFTIGKPKLEYAKLGTQEYLSRLNRYTKAELIHLKEGTKAQESQRLLEAAQGCTLVVMDERGQHMGSIAFSEQLQQFERLGAKTCAFLIGGAEGHTPELRKQGHLVLSLSKMAFQHELALVALLEQLYRAATIQKGEPYHRE